MQPAEHVVNDLFRQLFGQSRVFICSQVDVEHLTANTRTRPFTSDGLVATTHNGFSGRFLRYKRILCLAIQAIFIFTVILTPALTITKNMHVGPWPNLRTVYVWFSLFSCFSCMGLVA